MMPRGDGCGVGTGLDSGHVGVVADGVDAPARDVLAFQVVVMVLLLLKVMSRWNTISSIQQHSRSGTRPRNAIIAMIK